MSNFVANTIIFVAIVGMGFAASYRWGLSKAREIYARREAKKAKEEAQLWADASSLSDEHIADILRREGMRTTKKNPRTK